MEVYRSIDEIPHEKDSCLTVGTFDGVHLGHRKIVSRLVRSARRRTLLRSVLITFSPHPQMVVQRRDPPIGLLTPLPEKIGLLEGLHLDVLLVLSFTHELAGMKPEVFVEDVVVRHVGVREFIIGYNHAFGQERRGGEKLLRELGTKFDFSVAVVPPVDVAGETVSSTRIRKLLYEGQVRRGNRLLGRHYSLKGVVTRGKRLGKQFGFPTANVEVSEKGKLIPGDGVYAVFVHLDEKSFTGVANIGCRPTVNGKSRGVEVHIHDFSGDLYDRRIKLEFIDRIRDEKQFDSVSALVSQIALDREKSRKLLSKNMRREKWG